MANNISVTQGAGTILTTDQCSGDSSHMEVVKLAESVAGSRNYIPAAVATGLLVNVSQVQGSVTVAGSVGITGTVAATQSGTWNVGTVTTITNPVTVTGSVTISGTPAVSVTGSSVSITGTVAATQSGTWNVGTVTTITNPVTVTGSVTIGGTPAISGTVTANQGTAAAATSAWPMKLSDGTNTVSLTNVGGSQALNVNVLAQTGGGISQADSSTFTATTTAVSTIGGVFNDSIATVGTGKAGGVRITSFRAQHVNIRDNAGNELGIAAAPVRTDPTGTTTQPVSGTVTANQGGAPWSFNHTQINGSAVVAAAAGVQTVGIVNAAGVAFSQAAGVTAAVALPVQNQPSITGFWRANSQISNAAAQALHTPAGGKTAFIEGFIVTITTAGNWILFDNTSVSGDFGNELYVTTAGLAGTFVVTPSRPIPLKAINNVLRWTGTGSVAGDITAWGYDA